MKDNRPNFFVVGAPKAATSSLWAYLGQHPDIFVPDEPKESHFFSYPEVAQAYYRRTYVTTEEAYLNIYAGRTTETLAGDFSPSYLFYERASQRIKAFQPRAKIMIMLRNPMKRAVSHYLMDRRLGYQTQALRTILEQPETYQPFYREYVQVGLYKEQVERYLKTFDAENIAVLIYEDLLVDQAQFLKGIFRFLEVDAEFMPDTGQTHNAYRMPRSRTIERFRQSHLWRRARSMFPSVLKNSVKPLLDDREKPDHGPEEAMLKELFREDVHQLSDLLDRDLSFWLRDKLK